MSKVERQIIQLRAPLNFEAAQSDGKPRRFSLKAYTGKVVDSWWGSFVIDVAGMQTKEKVPILRNHDAGRIVGFSDEIKRDPSALRLSGNFSAATADAQEVLALADEGFPWQASIGVKPLQVKQLKNRDEVAVVNGQTINGPMEIWTKSYVGEVSMTPWGRDSDTEIQLLSEDGIKIPVELEETQQEGAPQMNLSELKANHPELYQEIMALGASSVDVAKLQAEAKDAGISEERARVTTILSVAEADQAAKGKAISEGLSAEASYKLFFEAETTRRKEKLAELETQKPVSAGASGKPKDLLTEAGGFMAAVTKRMSETKCSKASAIKAIASENPELHQAYLDGLAKK